MAVHTCAQCGAPTTHGQPCYGCGAPAVAHVPTTAQTLLAAFYPATASAANAAPTGAASANPRHSKGAPLPLPGAVGVPANTPAALAACLLARMAPGTTYTTQQLIALCGMANGHYSVHPVHAAAKRLASVGQLVATKTGPGRGARVTWQLAGAAVAVA